MIMWVYLVYNYAKNEDSDINKKQAGDVDD